MTSRWALLLLAPCASGCHDLERFDTGSDSAYCGSIVDASFVRQGFAQHTRMELRLDVDRLRTFPGRLSTDDSTDGVCAPQATFEGSMLRIPQPLHGDPLSLLAFGESREANLLAWVESTCDGSYLAVVSLMKSDDVEVRLMRGQADAEGNEVGPFGVFHLTRYSQPSCYPGR